MDFFKNKKRGFSLLELILAIAIFSLGSVALATLLIDANLSTKLALERTNALLYTREGIEAVRSIRDASSTTFFALADSNNGLQNTGSAWIFNGTSDIIDGKYTRVINIANTNSPATSSKTIISSVSWNLTSVRLASTTLTTILTNWRGN